MTDLAKLVVTLEAQNAKYQKGLDTANKKLDRFTKNQERALARQRKQWSALAASAKSALGVLASAATYRAVIASTVKQEQAIAQLAAAIRSTGGAAGFTSGQLQAFAGDLQKVTTFGDEAVIAMQSVLLTFTRIRGSVFKDASRAVLDLSTRMGTDLKTAALQVGKALNDPVKGVAALAEAGIQFTQAQRDVIKSLVATGDVAGAQRIILKELETQFGGSAAAARNTLGGALAGLKNAAGDLLEARSGLPGVTAELNNLTATLTNPAVVQAADSIASALVRLTGLTAKLASAGTNLLSKYFQPFVAAGELLDQRFGSVLGNEPRLMSDDTARYLSKFRDPRNVGGGPSTRGGARRPKAVDVPDVAPDLSGSRPQGTNVGLSAIYVPGSEQAILKAMAKIDMRALELRETFVQFPEVINPFWQAAADSMQSSMADFFKSVDNGVDGMVKGFAQAMLDIAANIAASKFLQFIGSGLSGYGGIFGSIGKALQGRASGGPVVGGTPYIVGEHGPELFVPSGSGRINRDVEAGGMVLAPSYNIDARGATTDLTKALPGILAANNRELARQWSQAMSRSGLPVPVL